MSTQNDAALPARLSTGDHGLDQIMKGGFERGTVTLVQGSPGAGKTILANQTAFEHSRAGGNVVYLTLLAESHGKLAEYMGRLDFFIPDALAHSIHYISGYSVVAEEGANGVLNLISEELRAREATLLVLDGLFIIEELLGNPSEFRKFVNSIGIYAELMDCTVLLLSTSKQPGQPELTMVDTWIELGRQRAVYRTVGYLEVHKMRGSDFIEGRHFVMLSKQGFKALPRLEASHGDREIDTVPPRLLGTGIVGLDQLLFGGVTEGTATLLAGPTGIGKTIMGLHFLGQASAACPGLLISFYEDEQRLRAKADGLGLEFGRQLDAGLVHLCWHPPTEHLLDSLGYEVLDLVRRHRIGRLVIDGINGFEQSAVYPERLGRFFSALANALRDECCTSLFTLETPGLTAINHSIEFPSVSSIADNMFTLRYVIGGGEISRAIGIVKIRDRDFDARIHQYRICANQGMVIGEVLSGPALSQANEWVGRR